MLRVTDLKTHFNTDDGVVKAVNGVSFSIAEGTTYALVGESGCGKSVTAQSIMRIVPAPPGRILDGSSIMFKGRELTTLAERDMRHVRGAEIAMIFQEPMTSLNPVFTCGQQIVEAIELHQHLHGTAARKTAIDMLDKVGIPEPARRFSEYPHQLSGGMRQRVMIAMALSCRPDLLIADEPTTALDVTIQAQILRLLRDLQKETGMSILLITHDLGVVAEIADTVGVMYASQLVEEASAVKLFNRPLHPYTQGLFASLPRLGQTRQRLIAIPGSVPNPLDFPPGCTFHTRCPLTRQIAQQAGETTTVETEQGSVAVLNRCMRPLPAAMVCGDQHTCACPEVTNG